MDLQPRLLAEGLGFIEGPAVHPDGRLAIASISAGLVHVLDASGRLLESHATGGGPNGLAWSGDALYVAQNGGIFGASGAARPGVQRIRDGRVEYAFDYPFEAPNDLAFGPDGRLWVTDPLTDRALHEPVEGRVVACDPETGRCEVMIEGRHFPNGLAFDATGAHLYLACTHDRAIERLSLGPAGIPSSNGVLCTTAKARPDGLAIDVEGNIWACTPGSGGVEVFDPSGAPLRRIELGEGTMTTNLCFMGGVLIVTASGRGQVLALNVGAEGLALHPFR
ncbi:SMP-30/gluconolactonase/LRE family protein [Roseomonas populi]|uniref:SMP-30/gluconolactonase/LRE family protein n=1 Tax=Roseomonas populi TaxID=3121582 RepID=A0ABT1X9W7_9PROT|nr:SMP-30/gluconolactonase/LRE family protein [Roseomonas pecuniae]MCR0984913.1 SMP-30/gluconolactonase/LRE family protein [Roseomonas pecuniae]